MLLRVIWESATPLCMNLNEYVMKVVIDLSQTKADYYLVISNVICHYNA